MGGIPHGLAGSTRRLTLCHEPASGIGAGGADITCPRVDDRVATTAAIAVTRRGLTGAGPLPAGDVVVFDAAVPTTEVHDAFQLALCPGAAKKAVVTFGH